MCALPVCAFAFTTLALVLDFAAGFATGFLALRAVFFAFDAIAAAPLSFGIGGRNGPENAARLKQTACRGATKKAAGTAAFSGFVNGRRSVQVAPAALLGRNEPAGQPHQEDETRKSA